MKKLSPLEVKVVRFLRKERGKGLYPSTLSEMLGVQYMKIVRTLKSLEAKGIVYSEKNQYSLQSYRWIKYIMNVALLYVGIALILLLGF